jgi:hypothetical protein
VQFRSRCFQVRFHYEQFSNGQATVRFDASVIAQTDRNSGLPGALFASQSARK